MRIMGFLKSGTRVKVVAIHNPCEYDLKHNIGIEGEIVNIFAEDPMYHVLLDNEESWCFYADELEAVE